MVNATDDVIQVQVTHSRKDTRKETDATKVSGKAETGLSAVSGKGSYAISSSKTFDKEQFDETVKLHPEE